MKRVITSFLIAAVVMAPQTIQAESSAAVAIQNDQVGQADELTGFFGLAAAKKGRKKGKVAPYVAGGFEGYFFIKTIKSHPQVNCRATEYYQAAFNVYLKGKRVDVIGADGSALKGKAKKNRFKAKATKSTEGGTVKNTLSAKQINSTSAKFTLTQSHMLRGLSGTACVFTYTGDFVRYGP